YPSPKIFLKQKGKEGWNTTAVQFPVEIAGQVNAGFSKACLQRFTLIILCQITLYVGTDGRQQAIEHECALAQGGCFTSQQATLPERMQAIVDGRRFLFAILVFWIEDGRGCLR